VNWELESTIFARCFHRSYLDPTNTLTPASCEKLLTDSSFLVTIPPCAPAVLANDMDQFFLEKMGVNKYRRISSGTLAHRGMMAELYPTSSSNSSIAPSPISAPSSSSSSSTTPSSSSTTTPSTKESLHRLCGIVIDSGYSFTHIQPIYNGNILYHASKRVNVGGKLITNYLKELISYKSWNMMEENYNIINQIKEKLAYVSLDYDRELQMAK
jgi:actin-related protein